jgi:hypothetical protein
MSLLRNDLQGKYCQIPNELITDKRLSNGAFRVLCLLFSKPDNWKVYNKSIMKDLSIKKTDTLSAYWKECIESGWLERDRITDAEDGTIGAYDYSINLSPKMVGTPEEGIPEKRVSPKNGEHNNTNSSNKTKENIKSIDASLISKFKEETNAGEVAINLMAWFIQYRKSIKKPIKTIAPMKLLITEMRKCINSGYKLEEMKELMESKEWQSIKFEWVEKELKKNNQTQPQTHDEKMAYHKETFENGAYVDWYGNLRDADGFIS